MKDLKQVVEAMKQGERGEYPCKLDIKIEGEIFKAYTVSITENDLFILLR